MTLTCKKCKSTFSDRISTGKKIKYYKGRKHCYICKPVHSPSENPPTIITAQGPQCVYCDKRLRPSQSSDACDNCKRQIKRVKNKIQAIIYKGQKCQDCGRQSNLKDDLDCFDFHHIGEKSFEINQASTMPWDKVKDELDKCIMLCAWCHRLVHQRTPKQSLWEKAVEQIDLP